MTPTIHMRDLRSRGPRAAVTVTVFRELPTATSPCTRAAVVQPQATSAWAGLPLVVLTPICELSNIQARAQTAGTHALLQAAGRTQRSRTAGCGGPHRTGLGTSQLVVIGVAVLPFCPTSSPLYCGMGFVQAAAPGMQPARNPSTTFAMSLSE
ncbi:hypothetical protein B0H14DRAFT_3477631 [Mycena olivaceomarginata]|nr:hypothetical protein B0H14DRAFT_3477631 [Mycena olivaceomarginata]